MSLSRIDKTEKKKKDKSQRLPVGFDEWQVAIHRFTRELLTDYNFLASDWAFRQSYAFINALSRDQFFKYGTKEACDYLSLVIQRYRGNHPGLEYKLLALHNELYMASRNYKSGSYTHLGLCRISARFNLSLNPAPLYGTKIRIYKSCSIVTQKLPVLRHGDKILSARSGGGRRGRIRGFSAASRKRMLEHFAMIRNFDNVVMLTLTFPDEFYADVIKESSFSMVGQNILSASQAALRAFFERFKRAFPNAGITWRKEIVRRKSGALVGWAFPHFHLVICGDYEISQLEKNLSTYLDESGDIVSGWWFELVASDFFPERVTDEQVQARFNAVVSHHFKLDRCHTMGKALAYVAKYAAKMDESGDYLNNTDNEKSLWQYLNLVARVGVALNIPFLWSVYFRFLNPFMLSVGRLWGTVNISAEDKAPYAELDVHHSHAVPFRRFGGSALVGRARRIAHERTIQNRAKGEPDCKYHPPEYAKRLKRLRSHHGFTLLGLDAFVAMRWASASGLTSK